MVDWQSFAGSAALEKSMHSSRFDFSSLQTQHGYGSQRVSTTGEDKEGTGIVGRTLGFEDASEFTGAGGCVIAAAAGMAGWAIVSECRAGLGSRACGAYE